MLPMPWCAVDLVDGAVNARTANLQQIGSALFAIPSHFQLSLFRLFASLFPWSMPLLVPALSTAARVSCYPSPPQFAKNSINYEGVIGTVCRKGVASAAQEAAAAAARKGMTVSGARVEGREREKG